MKPPGWYAWLALVISMMASVGLNVLITVEMSQRAVEAERTAAREAQEASRRATCGIVQTQLRIYEAAPPSTPTGREAQRAWRDAGILFRCQGGK